MTTMFAGSTKAAGFPAVRVFVLETKGTAILAFEAATMREAMELGRETWLRDDLARLTSNHAPLWDLKAPIKARAAYPEEAEVFRQAAKDDSDDLPIVYLIELDRIAASGGPIDHGAFPPRR
jgi:hypothetical protein